jgi:hypothetical protein
MARLPSPAQLLGPLNHTWCTPSSPLSTNSSPPPHPAVESTPVTRRHLILQHVLLSALPPNQQADENSEVEQRGDVETPISGVGRWPERRCTVANEARRAQAEGLAGEGLLQERAVGVPSSSAGSREVSSPASTSPRQVAWVLASVATASPAAACLACPFFYETGAAWSSY